MPIGSLTDKQTRSRRLDREPYSQLMLVLRLLTLTHVQSSKDNGILVQVPRHDALRLLVPHHPHRRKLIQKILNKHNSAAQPSTAHHRRAE